jgi:hypothetical protein
LGILVPIDDSFDFSRFLQPCPDLSGISKPFTHQEIGQVVANLPTEESTGLDGFTGFF